MEEKDLIEKGWILSNNERGDQVIQKYDESGRFKSDDEVTEFVVETYEELVNCCKSVYSFMMDMREIGFVDCGKHEPIERQLQDILGKIRGD